MNKFLVSIIGPTAIGKTNLSIGIAKHFNTEIISADSRQFYKEMRIGTAVPSEKELATIKHHFIHHKSIQETYTVGDFEKDALSRLDTLFKHHKCVVMVGGSGLYVDAVIHGLDDFPDVDPKIRKSLNLRLKNEGLLALQKELKARDAIAFDTIAIDNPHRVIRALEICIATNQPYSSFLNKKKQTRPFNTISIGLTADRELIYNRINKRVDLMVEQGLVEEVKQLLPYKNLNALNTVGYKELFKYFEGEWSMEFAISEIKKNTRRFAKRQLTWFKKDTNIHWFNYDDDLQRMLSFIEVQIKKPR